MACLLNYGFLVLAVSSILARADLDLVQTDKCLTPDIVLRVGAKVISRACASRYTVLINGTAPGPTITLTEGKTTWIRVHNDLLDKNVSMHWHGLSQVAAPWADGADTATQHPIPPGHFFDYEVHPEVGEAGTYFYHSHIDFQAGSANGALVVNDSGDPPYHYDEERIIHLTDYFNKTDDEIVKGLTSNPFVWTGETQAILVNGFGTIYSTTDGTEPCSMATLQIEPDKVYRFRIIAATTLSFVSLAFEGHNMTIIEADGSYTRRLETPYLQISSGQRYSVLIKAKTREQLRETGVQYFLQLETRDRPTLTRSYALLTYSPSALNALTEPETPPLELPLETYEWIEDELRPLTPNDCPSLEEVTRRITINVQQVRDGYITWNQNGLSWTPSFPEVPLLVALYRNNVTELPSYDVALKNGGMDPRVRAFPARTGEVLEVVIQNAGATNTGGLDVHPFHAHGLHFCDLGFGKGTYNEDSIQAREPIRRDTTILYRYETATDPGKVDSWRAWRIKTDAPGVWMVHCHILQHMVMGMNMPFVVGDTKDLLSNAPRLKVKGYLNYGESVCRTEI